MGSQPTSEERTDHQEAQKSEDELLRYWGAEVQRAIKRDSPWIIRGSQVVDTYRGIHDDSSEVFNILWANVEVLKPAVYNHVPVPEVERRFLEKDEDGNTMAIVMERTLTFCQHLPGKEFHEQAKKVRDDMLLPGRGVMRVYYDAIFEDEEIEFAVKDDDGKTLIEGESESNKISEECWCGYVYWKDFAHSFAHQWEKVWWTSFASDLTREQLIDRFGEKIGSDIPLAGTVYDNEHYYDEEGNFDYSKILQVKERFARVWEIWDKDTREVITISEGYENVISREDDPYGLEGFFPTPEPLYSISTTGTLIPVPEYTQYQYQAEELNQITRRITRLTEALKARGIGDAEIKSLSRLFDGEDNMVIPDEEYGKLMQAGGVTGAISWAPIDMIGQVLGVLKASRRETLNIIYEITGVADIMRGASDPRETATAILKKGQYGSMRVRERQSDIQNYLEKNLQLMGEVIAEMFDPETMILMSGVENRPDLMEGMDRVMAKLEDNEMRNYTIRVQTDSTVSQTDFERKEELRDFFGSISILIKELVPAVENGILPEEVAKQFMLYAARRFDVGRELENVLKTIGDGEKKPNPQQQAMMAQQEAMKAQMELERQKLELEKMKTEMKFAIDQAKLQLEVAKLQSDMEMDGAENQVRIAVEMIKLKMVRENAKGGVN